eukprot:scaffold35477_cov43-Cyclotella_meneghiniana.AAC.10
MHHDNLLTGRTDCNSNLSNNSHIGAYLYWDTNLGQFICSGKTDEHEKAVAKHANTDNKFYTLYPTRDNPRSKSNITRGVFESLVQFETAAFDKTSACVDKDCNEGGVMIPSKDDKEIIKSSMKSVLEDSELSNNT